MALFDFLKKKNTDVTTEETDLTEDNILSEEEEDITEEETQEQPEEETVEEISEETEVEDTEDIEEADNTEDTQDIEEAEDEEDTEVQEKKGFFARIKSGLEKTRNNIISGVENVLKAFVTVDEDLFEELEEALIMADIGVETSVEIIDRLRDKVKSDRIKEVNDVRTALVGIIRDMLTEGSEAMELKTPAVILVIGVNGVGKTTTIGKLAHNFRSQGKSVMLAAADTFRAAAIDQLKIWGDRNNVPVIAHSENSDPAAVVFDAVQSAKSKNTDILICDTAGRLHNKKNLMEELKKIARVIDREYPDAHTETLLVLDATTGQNALQQAKLFGEAADITGLVLTKLDGTAKGGVVIAIKNELEIPVRYIGVGEGIDDLQEFDQEEFARALFD